MIKGVNEGRGRERGGGREGGRSRWKVKGCIHVVSFSLLQRFAFFNGQRHAIANTDV